MIALALFLAAAVPADAPQPAPPPTASNPPAASTVSPDHAPERLTALLAAKAYLDLGNIIGAPHSEDDIRSDLDWLRDRLVEGNTAFIPILYARLLWLATDSVSPPERQQMRQSAAMALVYARAAVSVDGLRCGDPTAPAHRIDQIMTVEPGIWSFLWTMPAEGRKQIVDLALALETKTAAIRDEQGDIDFICRNGAEETRYDRERRMVHDAPAAKGRAARSTNTEADARYAPSLVAGDVWRPKVASARLELPAMLDRLVNPAAPPTAVPPLPATGPAKPY